MPLVHFNLIVRIDDQVVYTLTQKAAVAEAVVIDREHLAASLHIHNIFGVDSDVLMLTFPDGATASPTNSVGTHELTLETDGVLVLTSAASYGYTVPAVGARSQGLG